jgi:peptidoglycan hydrolase-like protein with peptidoglycan-binding domain
MRTLKIGMSGEDVRAWQAFLESHNFNPGAIDGEFGLHTEQATRGYQHSRGLQDDGAVCERTQARARSEGFVEPVPPSGESEETVVRTIAGVRLIRLAGGQAVFFTSRMHIDADGCPQAYGPDNSGIEDNRNAQQSDGSFSPDVIVLNGNGHPVRQGPNDPAPGFFISMTALSDPDRQTRDPRKWVNALTVPYIVLPGGGVGGAQAGDAALVIDRHTGTQVKAIVGDIGPRDETGEGSMFLAGRITGMSVDQITEQEARTPESFINPRSGGTEEHRFRYIAFPGTRMRWPKTVAEIEARVDAALASLTTEQRRVITA